MPDAPYEVFAHVETTGVNPDAAHICRLSLIERRSERVFNTVTLIVNCKDAGTIPPAAERLHQISLADTTTYGISPLAAHKLFVRTLAHRPVVYGYNVQFVLACLAANSARVDPKDHISPSEVDSTCVQDEAYDFLYGDEADCGQMKLPRFEEAWVSIMRANRLGMATQEMNPQRALRVFDIARLHDRIAVLKVAGVGHLSELQGILPPPGIDDQLAEDGNIDQRGSILDAG